MSDETQGALAAADDLSHSLSKIQVQTNGLAATANTFSRAMTQAFTQSVVGGKQFDDVLKSMALKMSNMAVTQAFKPISDGLAKGMSGLLSGLSSGLSSGLLGGGASGGTPALRFADGGFIGTPTYFPMPGGGTGLAGEAGPEAIVPLARGPDGRLGIAGGRGGGGTTIQVHIATPDAESFRRSETYLTGQIARAVARGQRSL